jgi:GNAT superfamily N-acetyltransferase
MRIERSGRLPADQTDVVWQLYNDAFDELRCTAVQRHVMIRDEFEDVMDDHRVAKYLGVDTDRGGRLCALATLTNDLAAMPLISPNYFERRWPAHFAEGRIWYIGFVAVHPDYRSTGLFEMVVHDLYRVVSSSQGVAALDFCRRNEEQYRLPQSIHRLLESWSGPVRTDRMDEQSYWFYEFSESR